MLGDWVTMAEAAASSSPEDEDETGELVEDGAEAESQSPSSHSSPPATTLNIYNPIQENVDKSHSQLPITILGTHSYTLTITIFYHNKTTNKSITLLIKYQVAADQVCPTNPSQRLIQNRRLIFVRVGRVQELITVSSPRDISLTSRVWSVLPGPGPYSCQRSFYNICSKLTIFFKSIKIHFIKCKMGI